MKDKKEVKIFGYLDWKIQEFWRKKQNAKL